MLPERLLVAEKRTKVQVPGKPAGTLADAVEVNVEESTERWTDIKLSDGTEIRMKTVVLSVLRLEGEFDQDGNPMYQLKLNQVMTANAPAILKRGAGESKQAPH
jgi:hypothetical protein